MVVHSKYFTYILRCADNTFYTGKTCDIEHRLRQHNGEIAGGAKYTRTRRPVYLHHIEEYETHKEAFLREMKIKKLHRGVKEKLGKKFTII